MMRLGIAAATIALLPLAGCSGDATPKAEPTHGPTPVECMSHQSVAVALKPERAGLPEIDATISRSWEPGPFKGGQETACADIWMERPPSGWKFVRYDLRMHDWQNTTTLSSSELDSFGTDLQLVAYECVTINATVVLARNGEQARWSAKTTISPRCPKG